LLTGETGGCSFKIAESIAEGLHLFAQQAGGGARDNKSRNGQSDDCRSQAKEK